VKAKKKTVPGGTVFDLAIAVVLIPRQLDP
jgi:hypothetical protein